MKLPRAYPENKAGKAKTKTEILYGINPVTEAIGAGKRRIFEVFISRTDFPGRTKNT